MMRNITGWRATLLRRVGAVGCVLALAFTAFSCGDEGTGDGKTPFGPPSKTTRYIFGTQNTDGSSSTITAGVIGEKIIQGESYWLAEVTHETGEATPPKSQIYVRFDDPLHGVFAGGRIDSYGTISTGDPNVPFIEGEVDEPQHLTLDPPVGETITLSMNGTGTFMGQPATATFTGSYTLVEKDVPVETVMGVIHDCRILKAQGTISSPQLPEVLAGVEISGDLYYSESKGVVGAIVRHPPFEDIVFGLVGVEDLGEGDGTYGNIQKAARINGGENFELSTHDVNNDFDADKNSHAKMILELRYIDETLAKGDTQPQANVEFTTVWGSFPYEFIASPISFFHPEEQGLGYTYWIAYVDQAAKNESENGISYNISARTEAGAPPLRATARILYKRYQP